VACGSRIATLEAEHNAKPCIISWRFPSNDERSRLHDLYPVAWWLWLNKGVSPLEREFSNKDKKRTGSSSLDEMKHFDAIEVDLLKHEGVAHVVIGQIPEVLGGKGLSIQVSIAPLVQPSAIVTPFGSLCPAVLYSDSIS